MQNNDAPVLNKNLLYFRMVLVTLFWGGTFVAGKIAGQSFDPFVTAFWRFFTASIFLVIVLWRRLGHFPKITVSQFKLIILAALTGIMGYNIFFFNGLNLIEAGRAAIIIALNPIGIMIFAAILGMEKLTSQRVVGIFIALVGAITVLSNGNYREIFTTIGLGEMLLFGCVFCWVAYTLVGRKLLQELTPLVITTYASLLGCLGLFFPAITKMQGIFQSGNTAWWMVVYLGILGTGLGFVWYYDGIKAIGATRAGIFINLVPVWGVLLGAIVLDESIASASLIGGVITILGVIIVNYTRSLKTA